jgi:hypothetical protein
VPDAAATDDEVTGRRIAATPIFGTLNDAKLTHKMIEFGVVYDGY